MIVKPTESAKDWWDINKEIAEEVMIEARRNGAPLPWNPVMEFDRYGVTLYGHVAENWGTPEDIDDATVVVSLRLDLFNEYYQVSVPDGTNLEGTGWVEA